MNIPHAHCRSLPQGLRTGPFVTLGAATSLGTARREVA